MTEFKCRLSELKCQMNIDDMISSFLSTSTDQFIEHFLGLRPWVLVGAVVLTCVASYEQKGMSQPCREAAGSGPVFLYPPREGPEAL